jgi:hypothetical protein
MTNEEQFSFDKNDYLVLQQKKRNRKEFIKRVREFQQEIPVWVFYEENGKVSTKENERKRT